MARKRQLISPVVMIWIPATQKKLANALTRKMRSLGYAASPGRGYLGFFHPEMDGEERKLLIGDLPVPRKQRGSIYVYFFDYDLDLDDDLSLVFEEYGYSLAWGGFHLPTEVRDLQYVKDKRSKPRKHRKKGKQSTGKTKQRRKPKFRFGPHHGRNVRDAKKYAGKDWDFLREFMEIKGTPTRQQLEQIVEIARNLSEMEGRTYELVVD